MHNVSMSRLENIPTSGMEAQTFLQTSRTAHAESLTAGQSKFDEAAAEWTMRITDAATASAEPTEDDGSKPAPASDASRSGTVSGFHAARVV